MSAKDPGSVVGTGAMEDAFAAYSTGDFDTTRVLCDEKLRAEPANAAALMLLGLITKKSLQIEAAIPLLEQSVRIDPNPVALMDLADCLWRVGRLEEAWGHIEKIDAISANNVEVQLLKAAILQGQHRLEEALACVRAAEKHAQGSALVAARYGCILTGLEKYEDAEHFFSMAARLSPEFRHCGLVNFGRASWQQLSLPATGAQSDEFVVLRPAGPGEAYDAVIFACCDVRYFYKYGTTFVNSFAQNAARGKLLHLHVLDPDAPFAAYIETLIAKVAIRNVAVTYEYAPVDEEPDFNLRRTFYSCARFLRMGALLAQHQKTIACFDIDTVFEAPLEPVLGCVDDCDLGLVFRYPLDSPWLDIVANAVIVKNTPQACRYFSAVANFIRHFVGRGKLFWHLDQLALYCVLKMMERFDTSPRVAPIAAIAGTAIWHIGNPYDYRFQEYRVTRYLLPGFAPPAASG